jgi:hypothetical protein
LTIAAGFVGVDGVLLCADSQYTGLQKTYEKKIFSRHFGSVSAAIAFTGDSDYGRSAIEDCFQEIQSIPTSRRNIRESRIAVKRALQKVLDDCKKANLSTNTRPEFIIALSEAEGGPPQLFSGRKTAVPRVDRFELRGSGSYLGEYIMSSFPEMVLDFMTIEDFVLVGLNVVATAKYHDAFCGGGSQFMAMRANGEVSEMGAYEFDVSDDWILEFDRMSRRLFLATASTRSKPKDFELALASFIKDVRKQREQMHRPGSPVRAMVEFLRNGKSQ